MSCETTQFWVGLPGNSEQRYKVSSYQHFEVSESGDVSIVNFKSDRIMEADMIDELGGELIQLADTDTSKVLLDFSNIAFLSSAALSRLIVMHKHCLANAVSLKLSGMTSDIEKVFTVTRLNTLFDIHAEQAGALASF